MPKLLRFAFFTLALLFPLTSLHSQTTPYDLIIRNGHIIDRTGPPWYSGDIGIRNGPYRDHRLSGHGAGQENH